MSNNIVQRSLSAPILLLLSILTITACLPSGASGARGRYAPSLKAGAQCDVAISALHPTQLAIGYWEIDQRAKQVLHKKPKKLVEYMEEHVGQIVIGPGGEPYIIDRHHLAFLMQRTRLSATIPVIVEANFSNLTMDNFWKEMAARKWVYLYDGHGKGPLDTRLLPKKIQDLEDDPFRSLAWAVREQGGYDKTDEPFAEFQWADFFRNRLIISADSPIDRILPEALKMCHSAAAHGLPGFIEDTGAR